MKRRRAAILSLSFASVLAAAAMPRLAPLTVELGAWCMGVIGLCLPYMAALGKTLLYAASALISGGLLYGAVNAVRRYFRARGILTGLPVADRGFSIVLIRDPNSKLAFTHGLVRPRIYVSIGLINGLTRPELHAVLLHEIHHRNNRDPLKLFFLGFLKDALFYLPVAGWAVKAAAGRGECEADDSVVRRTGRPLELASALLKVSSQKSGLMAAAYQPSASIRGDSGAVGYRIRRVAGLGGGEKPRGLTAGQMLASFFMAVFLLFSLLTPALASGGMNTNNACCKERCSMYNRHSHGMTATDKHEAACGLKR